MDRYGDWRYQWLDYARKYGKPYITSAAQSAAVGAATAGIKYLGKKRPPPPPYNGTDIGWKPVPIIPGFPPENKDKKMAAQDTGQRYVRLPNRYKRFKRFNIDKVTRMPLQSFEYILGTSNSTTPFAPTTKYLVSEFNPGSGGFIPCGFKVGTGTPESGDYHPMHIVDLNYFNPRSTDNMGNYPIVSTTGSGDANARKWVWSDTNKWIPARTGSVAVNGSREARWHLRPPDGNYADLASFTGLNRNHVSVFRKSIDIRMMLYGCHKMATEFDVRIIQILDPKMCPDYQHNIYDQTAGLDDSELLTFKNRWSNLIRPWTVNPIIRGMDKDAPRNDVRWFKTVMKRRVSIGETTTSIESVPSTEIRMHLDINEKNSLIWDHTGLVENTDRDAPPNVNADEGVSAVPAESHEKVYYTKRYYLLIRALAPVDVASTSSDADVDGTKAIGTFFESNGASTAVQNFVPSYDLCARTFFLTTTAVA